MRITALVKSAGEILKEKEKGKMSRKDKLKRDVENLLKLKKLKERFSLEKPSLVPGYSKRKFSQITEEDLRSKPKCFEEFVDEMVEELEKIEREMLGSVYKPSEESEERKVESEKVVVKAQKIEIPKFEDENVSEIFLKSRSFFRLPRIKVEKKKRQIDVSKIRERYPLVKWKEDGEEFVMAEAEIKWDKSARSLKYYLHEVKLSDEEKKILERARGYVREKLDVSLINLDRKRVIEAALNIFKNYIKTYYKNVDKKSMAKLEYYFYRDTFGLERIEPLMHDPNIEDISCDGVGIPIFIYHSNPLYGSLETNIVFETREELDLFIYRLAQICGKGISVSNPLLDAILYDGSRVQATLGSDIARRGSNFTIRKFKEKILTPIDLLDFKTADENIFVYLWYLIENGMSILIAGPTASGKTTFLNAISLFIKPEAKIVTIEDTAELRLPHPNWIAMVERRLIGKEKYAEVTMYDLLKASLRQRPDYIIVGEVRGREANVLFHAMETGHSGLGTIHAEDLETLIGRLTSPPINLPVARIQALDCIVFLTRRMEGRTIVRRVLKIVEIVGYDRVNDVLKTSESFGYDISTDSFIAKRSFLLEKCRTQMGMSKSEFEYDYYLRVGLIKWLRENGVNNYQDFFKYIRQFYFNKSFVEDLILKNEKKRSGSGK